MGSVYSPFHISSLKMSQRYATNLIHLYTVLKNNATFGGRSGVETYISATLFPPRDGRWDTTGFLTCAALSHHIGNPETVKIWGNFKGLGYDAAIYDEMRRMTGETAIAIQRDLGGMKLQPNTFMHITYSDGRVYVAANGKPEKEEDLYDEIAAHVTGIFTRDEMKDLVMLPFSRTNLDNGAEIVRMLTFSFDPKDVVQKMKDFCTEAIELSKEGEAPISENAIAYMFSK